MPELLDYDPSIADSAAGYKDETGIGAFLGIGSMSGRGGASRVGRSSGSTPCCRDDQWMNSNSEFEYRTASVWTGGLPPPVAGAYGAGLFGARTAANGGRKMRTVQKTSRLAIAVAVIAVVAGSCTFVRVGSGSGSGVPCHQGTWELSGQTIADAVGTIFGDLTITPDNDGMTLELDSNNTFQFSGSQTLGVSGSTPYGVIQGTVDVAATVAGSYTTTSTTITFTLGSISGSAQFNGTVNGMPYAGSWSLAHAGLDDIYGLSGTADMTCSGELLTLDFGNVAWDF